MIDQLSRQQLIYSVNSATDLDSWDIENLRYIRKISIRDSDNETLSYVSEADQDVKDQDGQQLNSSPASDFILASAKNYGHNHSKPAVLPTRVLQEELITNDDTYQRQEEEEFSACYLMDVLLVTNESLPRSPAISPSVCSADSFAYAICKGFFEMEHEGIESQKLAQNMAKRSRVKKSVSFMDETIQLPQPKSDHGRNLMRRGGSIAGTSTGAQKPILNHRVLRYTLQPRPEIEPSVPWTGKLVTSDTFQLGYASNWIQLETYVRRLQHTNSL